MRARGWWREASWGRDAPIYKSIDGGSNWHPFILGISEGSSKIVVRYPNPNQVVVYAATNEGVYRYKSNDPFQTNSQPSEWVQILDGIIEDLVVHPTDPSLLYASVVEWVSGEYKLEGLYRTSNGEMITSGTQWEKLTSGLPYNGGFMSGSSLKIDIQRDNPNTIYVSLRTNQSSSNLGSWGVSIYGSNNGGNSWNHEFTCLNSDVWGTSLYNDFVRVHPTTNIVYFGGVKFLKGEKIDGTWTIFNLPGVHDDMKDLGFSPHHSDTYYILNDGGIWEGTTIGGNPDSFIHRNTNLQVTQFYDFSTSQTNDKLMIGGTQDVGTILFAGNSIWRMIKGGDGLFSVIAPGDQIFYAQHQSLASSAAIWYGTMRSDKGVNTHGNDWIPASGSDPFRLPEDNPWTMLNAYITVHPNNPDYVLAQGEEVYWTYDGGLSWEKSGPSGSVVKADSYVRRVLVQPQTHTWLAGTSKGQIWYRSSSTWHLALSHPDDAKVKSMAFAPTNHKVLWVAYEGGNPYRRVQRIEETTTGGWTLTFLGDNLPTEHIFPGGVSIPLEINCIAGDANDDNVVYIGTNKGVFRGDLSEPTYNTWEPYNDGLPLTRINDILVDPTSGELRVATYGRGAWASLTP